MTHTAVRRTPSVALSVVLALGALAAAPDPAHAATPWPGGTTVTAADPVGLGSNVSGLAYVPSGGAARGTMWAVRNDPSELLRLAPVTGGWAVGASHWSLTYTSGTGAPDAEGVTTTGTPGEVYVVSERNNGLGGTSRPSVLRYAPTGPGTISATAEWDLTTDLPGLGANTGPEGIAWVPDSYLTARGLVDQQTSAAYRPADYPGHGTGLFLVGIEEGGQVLAYALKSGGAVTRIASFASGLASVMELTWDPGARTLWALCDNGCQGRSATFEVSQGAFRSTGVHDRPSGMADLNNEGFTMAPATECVGGRRPAYWSDDSATGGVALRSGTIDCPAPPTIRATLTSARPRRAGWWSAPVRVTFACTAGDAPVTCPAAAVLATSRRGQVVRRTVTDGNGMSASVTVAGINVDRVKPRVRITGAMAGRTYAGKRKVRCAGSDALSGIARCVVRQERTGKRYRVTAAATDRAGNLSRTRLVYRVRTR